MYFIKYCAFLKAVFKKHYLLSNIFENSLNNSSLTWYKMALKLKEPLESLIFSKFSYLHPKDIRNQCKLAFLLKFIGPLAIKKLIKILLKNKDLQVNIQGTYSVKNLLGIIFQ